VQRRTILILFVIRKFLYLSFGRHVRQILQGTKCNSGLNSECNVNLKKMRSRASLYVKPAKRAGGHTLVSGCVASF